MNSPLKCSRLVAYISSSIDGLFCYEYKLQFTPASLVENYSKVTRIKTGKYSSPNYTRMLYRNAIQDAIQELYKDAKCCY